MRKDRYLVGYYPTGNVVYGKAPFNGPEYILPMTEKQAKRYLKAMPCSGARIYKLVEVKKPCLKTKQRPSGAR